MEPRRRRTQRLDARARSPGSGAPLERSGARGRGPGARIPCRSVGHVPRRLPACHPPSPCRCGEGLLPVTVRTVTAADTRFLVREEGRGGGTPVLLLHGVPETSSVWRDVAPK